MDVKFQDNGNLEPGVHLMTINDFEAIFARTEHRANLVLGLKLGLTELADCGCRRVFIDGSFVTLKIIPGDFDACWDAEGVDIQRIMDHYPTLIDFREERRYQKDRYSGEFFPAQGIASTNPYSLYYDFFQNDKNNDPKGIVQINLI